MNSPFANLYLKVAALLKQEVPQIKYVDQDLGQLENYADGERPAVSWPCALLDIDEMAFTDMADYCQTGEGILTIRIGFAPYSSANGLAPDAVKEKALEYYQAEQMAHYALHGFSVDNCRDIVRISRRRERRNDAYRVIEVKYKFGMEDYSTSPVRKTIPRPPAAINATQAT